LEGAAVSHVRIKGADHEFSTLQGVVEDVTVIILNVKSLIVKLDSDTPKTMRVSVRGKPKTTTLVTAARIEADPAIEIINKDQLLCTLTDDVEIEIEMTVGLGRSYVTAAEHRNEGEDQIIGVIPVDSVYSPVTRVRYRVEDTRVGQRTNYDRLVLEVWTNGTLTPEMAVVEAAKILRKHLNPFVQYFEMGSSLALEGSLEEGAVGGGKPDEAKLSMTIGELDLSVRARNCLASANIATVGQLIQMDEGSLLKLRSFGKTSLREVKRKLAEHGLSLRVDLGAAPLDLSGEDDEEEEPVAPPPPSYTASRPATYSGAALDSGSMGPLSPPAYSPQADPSAGNI
jgi:DNA-directed RNA polymerase subunit alpha